jgi:hypothetical protein
MKKLIAVLAVSLSACSMMPSTWDANQSRSITDIQQIARHFDCSSNVASQATTLQNNVEWFEIYSTSKGSADISKLTETLNATTQELITRSSKGPISPMYCDIKKKILIQQSDIIAGAVQGRY